MMIDHQESRMWVAHHDQFSQWMGDALSSARAGLSRLAAWDGSTTHLLALIASLAITSFTFNHTAI